MKNWGLKAASIGLVVLLAGAQASYALAASLDLLSPDPGKTEELLRDNLKKKLKQGTYFLLGIESKLKGSKDELTLLRSNIKVLEKKIRESSGRIESLQSQIQNLDQLISVNEQKVRAAELQIAQHENAIALLDRDIQDREEMMEEQIASLDAAMNAYYLQTSVLFENSEEPSLLAFLSADESVGEVFKEYDYLSFLQNASQTLAQNLIDNQRELDSEKKEFEERKEKIADLQTLLARESRTLAASQEARKRLLNETKGKQAIYETLLELSKKEEEQVSQSIARLKENYAFFQSKLDDLKKNPLASRIDPAELTIDDEDGPVLLGDAPLAWPVSPSLGLTALFRDQEYKKALGVEHNAIDIRLPQGSKVKSAADGVVSKVADNGFAYSYIIIAHPDKILTLYGHVSEILVKEGEIVRQGQIIGLSGGIPGTKGAGWLTTGAHLHFEVFKNFQHVDPLEYLPLEYVPVASLPEKYLEKLTGAASSKVPRE